MKLLILGATGGVGMELVRQAIDHGHTVTAFVRSAEKLSPFRNEIVVRQGDVMDAVQLERAIEGQDAVISGFGPRVPVAKADHHLLRDFATALCTAMQRAATKRAVIVSTAFLFKDSILPPTYLVGRLFFPSVVTDAAGMEEIVRTSKLDWTIVRPPQFTDGERTGRYRIREGHLPRFGFKIARADVADCLLKAAEEGSFLRTVVGASN